MTEHSAESAYNPTASKILDTATRLFMQLGYRAVSINDIVKAAQITKPTVYYYFPDKQELFAQMALRRLIEMHSAMSAALAGAQSLLAQLTAIAGVLLDAGNGDMRLMRHEMREHLAAEHQHRLGLAFQQHLFEPVRQIMQRGLDLAELKASSASQLTWMFLALMEAFHGMSGQSEHTARQAPSAVPAPSFTPNQIVGLFLYGVAGLSIEEK
jgi:AcrR family transcriptional regulator